MGTIKERAEEKYCQRSMNGVTHYILGYEHYIKGATEQKAIDIDKACEYIRNHINPKLTIYHEDTWCSVDEFVNKLRKAMEEE